MDQQTVLFFLALLGAAGGLWFRIEARISTACDKLSADNKEDMAKVDRRIDAVSAQNLLLQQQLSDFRLEVANNYVRAEAVQRTEERLIVSIEKLAAQMEKIIARLDALSIQQARGEGEPPRS